MIESVIELPFNRHVGIQKSSTKDCLLELPPGGQFLNHLETVHAGAQLALAEACSGEFLLKSLRDVVDVTAVVRRVEAKFKNPAQGRVTARIVPSESAVDQSLHRLEKTGRALLSVHVELHDESGAHALSATFEWFLSASNSTST